MSCRFDKDIIHKYIDNTIEPLELIILKEHIAVCQDCKLELELMNKLEDSVYEYFDNLPDNEMLEIFTSNVLDKCYTESNSKPFLNGMTKAWELNKLIAGSAVKYTNYLPGSKLAAKTAKKASKGINKAFKGYMVSSLKKLIAVTVK